MSKTFLFQAIQFSQTIHFSISMPLVLFNPYIEPYQVLPHWSRVDLGAMAMKGFSAFPKAPVILEPHYHCLVSYPGHSLGVPLPLCRGAVSVSTVAADRAMCNPVKTTSSFWFLSSGVQSSRVGFIWKNCLEKFIFFIQQKKMKKE